MIEESKQRIISTSLAQCKTRATGLQGYRRQHDITLTGHVVHEVPLDEQFKTQLHNCFATIKAIHEF